MTSANATKLYYTLDGSEPTTDDSEVSNGQIDLEALAGDKAEVTLTVKGWNSEGMSASTSAKFKIVAPGAPTVDTKDLNTTNTDTYPYWVDDKYGYLTSSASIKLTKPAGAETVYYSTDGRTPNIYSPTLSDDGIITLSETVVGQKTKIIAVAANRAGMSTESLTINCERYAVPTPSRPEIIRFSQTFTAQSVSGMTRLTPGEFAYYNNSGTITLENDKVVLEMAKAYSNSYTGILQGEIAEPQSAYIQFALTSDRNITDDTPFYRLNVYASQQNWGDIYKDQHKWVALSNNDINPIGLFQGYNEIYLHLRAVSITGAGEPDPNSELYTVSDVLTVKLVRKAPDAPTLTLAGKGVWNDRSSVPSLEYIGSTTVCASMSNPNNSIEYYFAEAKDGQPWPGADPGNVTFWPLPDKTNDISISSNGGANSGRKGRLYVRQRDKAHNLTGACALLDIEPIAVADYKLNDQNYRPAQQTLIRLAQDDAYGVKIMGVYETDAAAVNGKQTYYVYLMDQWGFPIKLVVNAATRPEILDQYADGTKIRLIKGDVIGRIYYHSVTGEGNKMPEIWVTPGSEDYTAYLPESEAVDGWSTAGTAPADCLERTKVSADNFNRKMRLRSLTWLGGNRVRTSDGTELTLYSRLKVDGYDFQKDMQQVAEIAGEEGTKLFAATGFVGQLNGQLALLTTEPTLQCPGTPNLFAPNPITGQPDADGYIAVNAISDEVTLTIKGNA
ncbi:MAG: hypothetical protein K2G82_02795, partial [Paramuribaculum sp.]|nr:hypothetical protein [Paramuribaculum sp.]